MAKKAIEVEALKHREAKRRNIPTAEFESVMRREDKTPVQIAYERRIPWDANGAGERPTGLEKCRKRAIFFHVFRYAGQGSDAQRLACDLKVLANSVGGET